MTKEEAKLVLDNARPQTKEIDRQFYDDEDLNNALDMAIKALEQQSSDDCVSRKQALSAISNLYPNAPFMRVNWEKWQQENKKYFECEDIIKALPPVTPTHGTCKDCKHWEHIGYAIPSNGRCKHFDDVWRGNSILPLEHGTTENFYCKDFERRE